MTRDDFIGLPLSVALGCLWDTVPGVASQLTEMLVPDVPQPPRFDNAIYRKEGVQYASETDARGLAYWHMRYTEDAARPGNKFADRDQKRAVALSYWLAWRRIEPRAQWTGTRNREQVTAEPPRDKPKVHARTQRDPHEPYGEPVDDSDIPE